VIIPQHDFVRWELGVGTAADQCQDIAPEQHFDDANPALEVYLDT
jgi:hypothetical protein